MFKPRARVLSVVVLGLLLLGISPVFSIVKPDDSALRSRSFRHDDIQVSEILEPASLQSSRITPAALDGLNSLGVARDSAYLDVRSGRWATLMPHFPLLPGKGIGNNLTWEGFAASEPATLQARKTLAWDAIVSYMSNNHEALQINTDELTSPGRVAIHDDGGLVQINGPRVFEGIPVRDSYVSAVIRHGNLVLFGTSNWGTISTSSTPELSADQAMLSARAFIEPVQAISRFGKSTLSYIPAVGASSSELSYRLAWVLLPQIDGDLSTWELLVDAHSGEILAFEDKNQYATARELEGGVYPQTNDGIPPAGVEQPDYPMPFMDLENAGTTFITDSGGNLLACVDGAVTTTLNGRHVAMNDACGAISESTSGNVLDLGTSGGIDCTVPAGASPGNTHASRTGSYELNRMIEMARGQLPDNTWLQSQLTANMNINLNCNAFWNGSTVNFYTSGGGCNNTGELATIFDHEWGHGMDSNDVNPVGSDPGEAIADVYAAIRLATSCGGRGFLLSGANCGGYGDACTDCTGIRDMDWAKHNSGAPHTVANFTLDGPGTPNGGCQFSASSLGPCGGEVHCEGIPPAEALWDLIHRDLQSAPYSMDFNTANEVGSRLSFLGSGPIGNWHTCTGSGFDGCAGTGGYLNLLAADDDNGNLADGTPHMQAIYAALNRHGMACATPTVQDSGCAGAPATAPVVVGAPLDRGASLTWGAVAGATKYKIYRTDGVFGCDYGKVLVGETTGTEFADSGLKNGTDAFYTVIGFGSGDTCFGPASSCTTVTPAGGSNMVIDTLESGTVTFLSGPGDGDVFLDNCEQATVSVVVTNIGIGSQTNVRITGVEAVGNPSLKVVSSLPLQIDNNLLQCETSQAEVAIQAEGLNLGDTVDLLVTVSSDQLSPASKTQTIRLRVPSTESDMETQATKTFTYETDMADWIVQQGTFGRTTTGGGSAANGTDYYLASSDSQPNACDHAQSPVIALSASSTMTLWTNYITEDDGGGTGTWYDRANVGLYDVGSGNRTLVTPSSGRGYDATGANGNCGTTNQDGWAGDNSSWATSVFNATALGSASVAGDLVQLDMRYGTDGGLHLRGFWFDEVTVTNFDLQVEDAQSNVCVGTGLIFSDGFESGNVTAWSSSSP